MNKDELIAELATKYHKVDEAGIHEGNTEAGITVWGVGVFEKIGDVVKKLNLTFYTEGDFAYWGVSEPNPDIPVPDPTFTDRTNAFIASKIEDSTIKFGYIMEISELTQKAMVAAVMPDNSDRNAIVSEDAEGVFTIEVL
ncbi:MAG: hypothetical protein KAQ89_00425 [Planctomycetes bacterium]|nr:hypothetical protein [Planctomycetota bacterium]